MSQVYRQEGVYLGLAHEEHARDAAIGSTRLKLLKTDPPEAWWESPLNTIMPVEQKEPDHYRLGTATHVAFLEGWDTFNTAYGILPTRETHPDALATQAQLEDALARRGLPSGGRKGEQEARLHGYDPAVQILTYLEREFGMQGKRAITMREFNTIRLLYAVATGTGVMADLPEPMTLRQAFTGGLSEVSTFWCDENGIHQKARFDKLKPRITLDLKTITKWTHADFRHSLLNEIGRRGYLVQAAHYEEGRHQLRRLVDEGKVFGGTIEQRQQLAIIAQEEAWVWMWCFAKTKGYPAVRSIRLNPDAPAYQKGVQGREDALANFMAYREMFGEEPGKMWLDPEVVWTPDEADWEKAGVNYFS